MKENYEDHTLLEIQLNEFAKAKAKGTLSDDDIKEKVKTIVMFIFNNYPVLCQWVNDYAIKADEEQIFDFQYDEIAALSFLLGTLVPCDFVSRA